MKHDPELHVSVVIPFIDDEERVGALVPRIAEHLRALGARFEILAVDEDSGDNSVAVLSLLRVPELRILAANGEGQGFAAGARVARGRVLWLIDIRRTEVPLAPFGWAHQRIIEDNADIVVVEGRYLVCRRTRVWHLLDSVRGREAAFERRLLWRARVRRLRITSPPRTGGQVSPWGRLVSTFRPSQMRRGA